MEFDSARFVLQLKSYYQQKASSTKKYRLIMILLFEPIYTKSGQRTVPQIWVGDTHVGGYSELQGLEANGELDLLLNGG